MECLADVESYENGGKFTVEWGGALGEYYI